MSFLLHNTTAPSLLWAQWCDRVMNIALLDRLNCIQVRAKWKIKDTWSTAEVCYGYAV
jgi:hypothetical protein